MSQLLPDPVSVGEIVRLGGIFDEGGRVVRIFVDGVMFEYAEASK